ncbi:MAG: hypothetical protein A2W25_07035 [candidate division Zixibacteria bacterium RBG_16_53_22]|nr:MAG: hypothetical protein A2W25_07035 [candidate division Zixibacteria bacterium RBG_16_53_22]
MATILTLVFFTSAFAIDSDQLPFGSQVLRSYTAQEVQKLADEMCFNYFVEYDTIGPACIDLLYDEGIQAIKGGIINWSNAEPPAKYSWSNYAIIDVDYPYPNEEVRMEPFGGSFANGMWVSPSASVDTLSGISTYQSSFSNNPPRNHVAFFDQYFFDFPAADKIPYRIDILAVIDNPNPASDTTVALVTVLVGMWNTCVMKPIHVDTIRVEDFGSNASLQWILAKSNLTIPDTFTVVDLLNGQCNHDTLYSGGGGRWNPHLRLDISTTGVREFKVDQIKISDDIGRQLMAGDFDDDITDTFEDQNYLSRAEKIYAWMLMDEPLYANYLPFHHIDSLMHDVYSDWITFTNHWQYAPSQRLNHSYLSSVDVDYIAPDIYPFGPNDVYAGDLFQDSLTVGGTKKYGPLYRFPQHISWVRSSVDQIGKNFWMTVQAFEDTGEDIWRYPTASELSAQIFISLAWGAKGIQAWFYDQASGGLGRGIRAPDGSETELYDRIRDHIGPYLQAVDEYYMPLTWDRCYTYKPDRDYDPPASALVESITTFVDPDSAVLNPDTGWYQVGEFHRNWGGGDNEQPIEKFLMVVNRACSQGESDFDEAPAVTAAVRLDPTNLGEGNYVYVIDLAHTTYFDAGLSEWKALPETTYTCLMPDGTIPFSTVLRAGEGRLFKIAEAPQLNYLSGDLFNDDPQADSVRSSGHTYQGHYFVTADAIVQSGKQFKVEGPAHFEIYRCDLDSTGMSTSLVEMIINGSLKAVGTAAESVLFVSSTEDYDCNIQLIDPAPGDWYGIRDRSEGRDTLAYCSIQYAYDGFRADTNCFATLKHCFITRCENQGFYAYNTCADTAIIDTCYFKDNILGGISAGASLIFARGNTLIDGHQKAAININQKPCGVTTISHILSDNFIYRGSGNGAFGIKVTGSSSSRPSVGLSGNIVRKFPTGIYFYYCAAGSWSGTPSGTRFLTGNVIDSCITYGISCSYSSPVIYGGDAACETNNHIDYNTYGLYSASSSVPKIKETFFKYNETAILCAGGALPILGDSITFYGYNMFDDQTAYDIKGPNPPPAVQAMGNFWGENPPDEGDFYPSAQVVNYRRWSMDDFCEPTGAPRIAAEPLPAQFAIHPNYPNPFNPTTTIGFDLPRDSHVRVLIYNLLGQRIRNLTDAQYPAGTHVLRWDGRNDAGSEVCSGVYFYLVETDTDREAKKMLMLR